MVRGPNHGRRRARADLPTSTPQPPLPVSSSHPCWCQRGKPHQIGDDATFWDNRPQQGVTL